MLTRIWAPSRASSSATGRCQKSSQMAMPDADARAATGRPAGRRPAAKKRRSSKRPYVGRNNLRWTCRISPSSSEGGGDEQAVVGRLLDERDDGREPARRRRQRRQARVVEAHGDLGGEVLQQVAGQAELREDDEVGAGRPGLVEQPWCRLEVLVEVPQAAGRSGPGRCGGSPPGESTRRCGRPPPRPRRSQTSDRGRRRAPHSAATATACP